MAAQRRNDDQVRAQSEPHDASQNGPRAPGDGLDAARGIGWGVLIAIVAFWAPLAALWRRFHR